MNNWTNVIVAFVLGLAVSFGGLGKAEASETRPLMPNPEVDRFVRAVVSKHKLDAAEVERILAEAVVEQRILDLMARPAEAKPWHEYRKLFLTTNRIEKGVAFWRQHAATLASARKAFGVPEEIVTAILGVETLYGQYRLRIRVIDALATLGFHYPRRAKFFRRELEEFLLLANEESLDVLDIKGSYAGAMGIPQFIPSSYRAYAVDFDQDGKRDLVGNVADAVGSVAAYLSRHGWRHDEGIAYPAERDAASTGKFADTIDPSARPDALASLGVRATGDIGGGGQLFGAVSLDAGKAREYWLTTRNFYAITRYNRSKLYAMAVFQLAGEIRAGYWRSKS